MDRGGARVIAAVRRETAQDVRVPASLTLPQLLLRWELEAPQAVALRHKELGRWRDISYGAWATQARCAAAGLRRVGVGRGDRVAILADNRPEWLYACVGAQGLGATVVGVYTTASASQIRYQLRDAGAKALVLDTQEQLDKVVEVWDDLEGLDVVIVIDQRGTGEVVAREPRCRAWGDVVAEGEAAVRSDPGSWDREAALARPDDVALLAYTSGTTGPPKGAMLTWRNWSWFSTGAAELYELSPSDELLSYLPLCHVAEHSFTLFGTLACGATASFAESVDTVQTDMREVQPTVWFTVPRISEKIVADVGSRVADATPLKRTIFRAGRRIGYWLARRRLDRRPHRLVWWERLIRWPCRVLVFRPLRKQLGFTRVRLALSGSAPISPDVLLFFLAMDIPILEAYGLTEGYAVTSNTLADMRLGTVGRPVPGAQVRLADDGEILTRGPGVFAGYWGAPDATREVLDAEGWLHTGDVGRWTPTGHLRVVGRKKDILITAGGKNVAPTPIENRLKASPYIREAVVIGDRRPFLVALLEIEFDRLADWAQRSQVAFQTYGELAASREVDRLLRDLVDEVNAELSRPEQLKAYRVLSRPLDPDVELTPTQKVKRGIVEERYAALVEELYRR